MANLFRTTRSDRIRRILEDNYRGNGCEEVRLEAGASLGYSTLRVFAHENPGLVLATAAATLAPEGGGVVNWETVPSGNYKILVLSENDQGEMLLWDGANNRPGNWDVSDQPFIVVGN